MSAILKNMATVAQQQADATAAAAAAADDNKSVATTSTSTSNKKKQTKRERFLSEMDTVVPWATLVGLIEPHHPKAGQGRRPYRWGFRIHGDLGHWYRILGSSRP